MYRRFEMPRGSTLVKRTSLWRSHRETLKGRSVRQKNDDLQFGLQWVVAGEIVENIWNRFSDM